MLRVSDLLEVGRGVDLAVFSIHGRRLSEVSDFLPCCIAIAEEHEFQQTPMSLWPALQGVTVDIDDLDQLCGGGGAKQADKTLVSTRVASLLLSNGVSLSDVTPAVESLVAAAGVPVGGKSRQASAQGRRRS